MAELPTGTVTFLFTDIEGSTRLWEQHPEAMQQALARHDALLRQAIETHGGHVFKTIGDQFCAVFATATDALTAALAAQCALQTEAWEAIDPLRARMALHTGAAEGREGDYFGPPLNRVARLLAAAHGGQTLLSQAVCDRVREALPLGAGLRDLGSHRLKDLQQPEPIFQLLHPALPADFPPLRSLEAFTHNLPGQLTRFIGREQEMAAVKEWLGTTRLLTLTGSGGCGKTRLALQVAADLLEQFADGVWLVELAPLADPTLVPHSLASTLGVREQPERPLTATLIDHLRSRQLLLVLDNCEHLLAACAGLADTLLRSCLRLQILASSREAMGIAGERTYRVPSLSLPAAPQLPPLAELQKCEAVELFTDRAALSQPAFAMTEANAPAVVQICRRLDGIPLAIELAAARVKVLSVEQIAARLDDRFRLLTGGSRTALPRQQTLRALIDWSYNLLSEAERLLLRRLSVFTGGWTLQAAEAVCSGNEIEEWEILELLTRLVDKSLVVVEESDGETRYRLLETIRQYARDHLLESGAAGELRTRHLGYFLTLAEQADPELWGPDQVRWLDRLEADLDNFRAALEWGKSEPERLEEWLRVAAALELFWLLREHASEGREWLEQAATHHRSSLPLRARVLGALSWLRTYGGDEAGCLEPLEESLRLYRELNDELRLGWYLCYRAMVARWSEQMDNARRWSQEALEISRAIGSDYTAAWCLLNLGMIEGGTPQGIAYLEESVELARRSGNAWTQAISTRDLGQVLFQYGDHPRATALLAESLRLLRQVGCGWLVIQALQDLGKAMLASQDPAAARALYEKSLLPLLREVKDRPGEASALLNAGRAARDQGDYSSARGYFTATCRMAEQLGDQRLLISAWHNLGEIARLEGKAAEAGKLLHHSLALAEECQDRGGITTARHKLALLALDQEDLTLARTCWIELISLAREWDQEDVLLAALEGIGRVCMQQGQPLHAARLLGAAEAIREAGHPSFEFYEPSDHASSDSYLPALQAASGDEAIRAAWAAGRVMTMEEALTCALEEADG